MAKWKAVSDLNLPDGTRVPAGETFTYDPDPAVARAWLRAGNVAAVVTKRRTTKKKKEGDG